MDAMQASRRDQTLELLTQLSTLKARAFKVEGTGLLIPVNLSYDNVLKTPSYDRGGGAQSAPPPPFLFF